MYVILYVLFFYSPGDLESTGEKTGGAVGSATEMSLQTTNCTTLVAKEG
jgi:hypothetical protein